MWLVKISNQIIVTYLKHIVSWTFTEYQLQFVLEIKKKKSLRLQA